LTIGALAAGAAKQATSTTPIVMLSVFDAATSGLVASVGAYSDNPIYLAQRERLVEGLRKAGVPE